MFWARWDISIVAQIYKKDSPDKLANDEKPYKKAKRGALTRSPFPTIQLTKIYHPVFDPKGVRVTPLPSDNSKLLAEFRNAKVFLFFRNKFQKEFNYHQSCSILPPRATDETRLKGNKLFTEKTLRSCVGMRRSLPDFYPLSKTKTTFVVSP